MLVPREKPYQDKLNSYYLNIDRFTEHLQGEIGSGCIYCKSSFLENLVYFNEQEIIRGIIQESGQHARVSPFLEPVMESLRNNNFIVSVYELDPNAVYFWGQMPPFKRAKKKYSSQVLSLRALITRFNSKKFSGFIDVSFEKSNESGLLFFNEGFKLGGSYSWGRGGLSKKEEDYALLLSKLEQERAVLEIGRFFDSNKYRVEEPVEEEVVPEEENDTKLDHDLLIKALEEFLGLFVVMYRKIRKRDPMIPLRQIFIKNVNRYPFLDPFMGQFTYVDGMVDVEDDSQLLRIIEAVVDCVWEVVSKEGIQKEFRRQLDGWNNQLIKEMSCLKDRMVID